MLSRGLECLLEGWNAFYSVGITLYTVEMISIALESFRQSWNTVVQSWNDFFRVGILSRGLEYF
jgi:hypothetical protein